MGLNTEIRFIVPTGAGFTGNSDDYLHRRHGGQHHRQQLHRRRRCPPLLYTLADLRAGEFATIVVNTTVDNPYLLTTDELYNIACAAVTTSPVPTPPTACAADYGDARTASRAPAGSTRPAPRLVAPRLHRRHLPERRLHRLAPATPTGRVAPGSKRHRRRRRHRPGAQHHRRHHPQPRDRQHHRGHPLDTGASRVAGDLSGASAVLAEIEYRCSNLAAGDIVALQVRPDASSAWVTLQSFSSCNNATTYSGANYALTPGTQYGTATEVRLTVTTAFDINRLFYVDSLRLTATYDSSLGRAWALW
jgi:hypothetical protein